jgi:hypothetical protein
MNNIIKNISVLFILLKRGKWLLNHPVYCCGMLVSLVLLILIVLLYANGFLYPSTLYYVFFRPSRILVPIQYDDTGLISDNNIPVGYKESVFGVWAIENPSETFFDIADWHGWQRTRLYLFTDGTFSLESPLVVLDYIWSDYHWRDRKGYAKDIHGVWSLSNGCYGLSIIFYDKSGKSSKFKYMMLWDTSTPKKSQYKLCQVKELPTDAQGLVWVKISDIPTVIIDQ